MIGLMPGAGGVVRLTRLLGATILDDLTRDVVLSGRKLRELNHLSRLDSVDDAEVARGQNPQVLAVLVVDPLNAMSDNDLDAG